MSTLTEDELTDALRDRLAAYKIPRRIVVVASIGRAANGKVDQRRWRDEAAQAVGRS